MNAGGAPIPPPVRNGRNQPIPSSFTVDHFVRKQVSTHRNEETTTFTFSGNKEVIFSRMYRSLHNKPMAGGNTLSYEWRVFMVSLKENGRTVKNLYFNTSGIIKPINSVFQQFLNAANSNDQDFTYTFDYPAQEQRGGSRKRKSRKRKSPRQRPGFRH